MNNVVELKELRKIALEYKESSKSTIEINYLCHDSKAEKLVEIFQIPEAEQIDFLKTINNALSVHQDENIKIHNSAIKQVN